MALAGFVFGLFFAVLGTLVEAARIGDLSPGGWWLAQVSSPLLWIIDTWPLLLGGLGNLIEPLPRAQSNTRTAKQLSFLIAALVLVPLGLLTCALQQGNSSAELLTQLNDAGYLRSRGLWIHHAQQTGQGDWKPSVEDMKIKAEGFRETQLEAFALFEPSWRTFYAEVKTGHLRWQTAEQLQRAANILTTEIERNAAERSQGVSQLLLLGMLSLVLGLIKCFDVVKQLRLAENELVESEGRLQQLSEAAFEGVLLADHGTIIMANGRMSEMFGYSQEEFMGMPVADLVHPDSRPDVLRAIETGDEQPYLGKGLRKDGTVFEWESEGKAIVYRGREVRVTAVRDVTERLRMEAALRETSRLQAAILQSAAHAIIATNAQGVVQTFNAAAEQLLGWRASEVVGRQPLTLWHDQEELAVYAARLSAETGRTIALGEALTVRPNRGETEENEWTYIRKDGQRVPVFLAVTALRDEDGTLTGYLGLSYDITDRQKQQAQIAAQRDELRAANERLHALATTDALTGTLNRRAFGETLEVELQRSARTGEPFSLVLMDVDRFKQFNDSFGHLAGDEVLVRTAQILRETFRPVDIVARYGGEEFAIILPTTLSEGAAAAAERCRVALEKAQWPQRQVTGSFGVATWRPSAHDANASLLERATHIIQAADGALYRAKEAGRNRVCTIDSGTGAASGGQ